MKFLVTGGAGFIGSHLIDRLIEHGDEVTVIDDFSSGRIKNLEKVLDKIEFHEGSILDKSLVDKLASNCDQIIHLAASVGVFNIINKPLESLKNNLTGTEIVLESANKFKKPMLMASTSEIYGKNNKVPLSEEDDRIVGHPLLSRWSYSEAKAIDESLAYFYYLEHQLPIRIVRFFNTVGPRQVGNYGMVLPRFVEAALSNQPLLVYGSGRQIRCFCHVSDVVQALLLILKSDKSLGQVFNVGSNHQISIMDLANRIITITGSKSLIKKIAYEKAYTEGFEDMLLRVPDISKINRELGWKPEKNLDQIIKDVAESNLK